MMEKPSRCREEARALVEKACGLQCITQEARGFVIKVKETVGILSARLKI